MEILRKLEILADAAKYDASCSSSGTRSRHSLGGKGVGSSEGSGICHAYAPDGRCISLLKILLTNFCIYECSYCINRNSSGVQRARFTVDEVVRLTLDFYKRNYIEGLFLSSGVIQSPDYTMAQLVEVARRLRRDHDFRGYIHLKTIPDADGELLAEAGRFADRLSINVELPTQIALDDLAPATRTVSRTEPTTSSRESGAACACSVDAMGSPDAWLIGHGGIVIGAGRAGKHRHGAAKRQRLRQSIKSVNG